MVSVRPLAICRSPVAWQPIDAARLRSGVGFPDAEEPEAWKAEKAVCAPPYNKTGGLRPKPVEGNCGAAQEFFSVPSR
jgi:hypothetical protein